MSSILLKGGTVLIHDSDDNVDPIKADVLIQDTRITKIEPNISLPPALEGCKVIDCTDRIISPGFVDTHRHLWQTPLKGQFADEAFMPYMAVISTASQSLTADDLYWANLAGAMEAIDSGTTTVLDHAHMNYSPEHSKQAIAGTLTSGLRSVFAYTPTMGLTAPPPEVSFTKDPVPPWSMSTLAQLASSSLHPSEKSPASATSTSLTSPESRVQLGFGFDLYFLPSQAIKDIFCTVKSLGVRLVTSHYVRLQGAESYSIPAILDGCGLLDGNVVLSHAGGATVNDAKLLLKSKTYISVTPETEASMAVGPSIAFKPPMPSASPDDNSETISVEGKQSEQTPCLDSLCSLGVDSHAIANSSPVSQMRTLLHSSRAAHSLTHHLAGTLPARPSDPPTDKQLREPFLQAYKSPNQPYRSCLDVFNLATIQGARALGMESDIGSIAIDKKADLVIWKTTSPSMVCAAQRDPVAAVVMHSGVGDVESVLVDGVMRKRAGELVSLAKVTWVAPEQTAEANGGGRYVEMGETVGWDEVVVKVLDMQSRWAEMLTGWDLGKITSAFYQMFHVTQSD